MNLKCNLCDLAFYKHVSIAFIVLNDIHVVMDHFVLSIKNTHLLLQDVSFQMYLEWPLAITRFET
jgi:hypothetical protein